MAARKVTASGASRVTSRPIVLMVLEGDHQIPRGATNPVDAEPGIQEMALGFKKSEVVG